MQAGDGVAVPGGVDDTQVVALQDEWLALEKGGEGGFARGGVALPRRIGGGIALGAFVEIPAGAVFGVVQQQVDFVVAEDALHVAAGMCVLVPVEHGGRIRAAVHEVTEEDEVTVLRMRAVFVVAEVAQQRLQRIVLAVNVADDVKRARGEGLDEGHGGRRVVGM